MSIKLGNTNITSIVADNQTINLVKDGSKGDDDPDLYIWARPFTLTHSKGTGVASITVTRNSSYEPTAVNGTNNPIANGGTVYYGDSLSVSATASTGYTLNTYTKSYIVSGNTTVSVTATPNKYAVYISVGAGVTGLYLSSSSTATSGSASGTTFDFNSTVYGFVKLTDYYDIPTDSGWVLISGTANATGATYRVGSLTVATSGNNFGAIYAAHENTTLTVTKNTGVASITVTQSSSGVNQTFTSSGTVSLWKGYSYSWSASASTGYTMSTSSGSSTPTGATATLSPTATINSYPVSITAGTGVSNVYLSTSSTATSGNASGTSYNYGTTVYGFAVLKQYYGAPSGWTLVSGTANTTGAKYRVGSLTVSTSGNSFGTKTANKKDFTVTITINTGVDKVYFRSPSGSGNYYAYSASDDFPLEAESTYDWYATAKSGYIMNTSSGSGTCTGNITISPTASAFTLQYPTIYPYGVVYQNSYYYRRFRFYNPNSISVSVTFTTVNNVTQTVTIASGWSDLTSNAYNPGQSSANNIYITSASVTGGGQTKTYTTPILQLWSPTLNYTGFSQDDVTVNITNNTYNPAVSCSYTVVVYTVDDSFSQNGTVSISANTTKTVTGYYDAPDDELDSIYCSATFTASNYRSSSYENDWPAD